MIFYKKGSLFEAPKHSILVHACNAQGVWGSGIAKAFHERFPESFKLYQTNASIGNGFVLPLENDYQVGCLVTSKNYGKRKDSKEVILQNTRTALVKLLTEYKFSSIHSCKFNAGLFGVPWKDTERVMMNAMMDTKFQGDWTVWDPFLVIKEITKE